MELRASREALATARRIHVMGVGGTGMGTFAGMLKARGLDVRGSDAGCYPPMSDLLAGWGIPVMVGYAPENLDWAPDVVIVGNVIRRVNPEAEAMRERGIAHASFPEALAALLLDGRHSIVVSGTHGKTTTTSLTAWLLESGGLSPALLVGGLPLNFGSSFRLGAGPHVVVEGDEYGTAYFDKGPKFLHYQPRTAVITNIEYDHADIYANVEAIEAAFTRFAALVPGDGRVIANARNERAARVARTAEGKVELFGAPGATWEASELDRTSSGTAFTLLREGRAMGRFTSPLFGDHNVENALAALAVAIGEGVEPSAAAAGLASFKNVKKRHEVKGVVRGVTVIDDFAHHPTAVRETVRAVRARFPAGRLFCAFEVESNTSRRRVFQADYPPAFQGAVVVVFCKPLEKADNLRPEEKLSLDEVVAQLRAGGIEAHVIPEVEDIVAWLVPKLAPSDVVLGMSGRHFHGFHGKLLEALNT